MEKLLFDSFFISKSNWRKNVKRIKNVILNNHRDITCCVEYQAGAEVLNLFFYNLLRDCEIIDETPIVLEIGKEYSSFAFDSMLAGIEEILVGSGLRIVRDRFQYGSQKMLKDISEMNASWKNYFSIYMDRLLFEIENLDANQIKVVFRRKGELK